MKYPFLNRLLRALVACMVLMWMLILSPAHAARMALVIGNDHYKHLAPLKNAIADAELMQKTLTANGFQVTIERNLNRQALKDVLDKFKRQLSQGDEAVFYFAGHGVQVGNDPVLLPVDIRARNDSEIPSQGLSLLSIQETFETGRMVLIVIDACRDNPFHKPGGTRSAGAVRGLSPPDVSSGQAVILSAGRGESALDYVPGEPGIRHGLFTWEFTQALRTPGQDVLSVLRKVRDRVEDRAKTVQHKQRPSLVDDLRGQFYLAGSTSALPAAVPQTPATEWTWPAWTSPGWPTALLGLALLFICDLALMLRLEKVTDPQNSYFEFDSDSYGLLIGFCVGLLVIGLVSRNLLLSKSGSSGIMSLVVGAAVAGVAWRAYLSAHHPSRIYRTFLGGIYSGDSNQEDMVVSSAKRLCHAYSKVQVNGLWLSPVLAIVQGAGLWLAMPTVAKEASLLALLALRIALLNLAGQFSLLIGNTAHGRYDIEPRKLVGMFAFYLLPLAIAFQRVTSPSLTIVDGIIIFVAIGFFPIAYFLYFFEVIIASNIFLFIHVPMGLLIFILYRLIAVDLVSLKSLLAISGTAIDFGLCGLTVLIFGWSRGLGLVHPVVIATGLITVGACLLFAY